jgi:hypothetical protein
MEEEGNEASMPCELVGFPERGQLDLGTFENIVSYNAPHTTEFMTGERVE